MLFRIKLNPASFNDSRQNPGLLARLKGRLSVSQGCDNFQRRLYRWMIYPPGVFSPWVLGCVSLPGNDTLEVRALIGPVSLFLS